MAIIDVKTEIDTSDLDTALKKAEKLRDLIKEAKSLADDLASGIRVTLEIDS